MEVFNLTIEQKVAVWERLYVEVEAESLEEAVMKCNDGDYDVNDSEIIYETMDDMTPTQEEPCTFEVYDSNSKQLFTNSIRII